MSADIETPDWAKPGSQMGNDDDASPAWASEGVVSQQKTEQEVEILTDLKEYFELEDVGKELVGTAVFQALFDLLVTIYNYRGYSGDIDRVDFTSVVTETYSKAFMLGWIVTAIGHFKARAKNKEKKQIIPFLHPSVLDEGALKYVPRGSSAAASLVTALFWTVVMGSSVVVLVLILWLMVGKDQDDDKMNGYLYSVYQAVIGGFFGWNVIAVGMIQGSTTIPPEILAAYERQKGGAEENERAHFRLDEKVVTTVMVDTVGKVFACFSAAHRVVFVTLVFAVASLSTAFTYGYLYDGDMNEGDGGLNRVEGRDQLIADMCGSTLFAAVAVSLACSWYKGPIENGKLPYLDPAVFDNGLLRGFPRDFSSSSRRVATNAGFWCAAVVSFTVAFSYILGVEIVFSGQSYVNMKIMYYIPLCGLIAAMNVMQLAADIPEADRERLEAARKRGGVRAPPDDDDDVVELEVDEDAGAGAPKDDP